MEHFHEGIQGWFAPEGEWLYRWRVEQAPADQFSRFVEVGCWKGRSAAFMAVEIARSEKPITFYCVDHWQGSDEPEHKKDPELPKIYEIFRKNLEPFPNVIPMRMQSLHAAKVFADESLDFVFIDASHDYQSVRRDIAAWLPKLKPEGMIAGDDWTWLGVRKAVSENLPDGVVFGNVWYSAVSGATPQQIVVSNYV